MIRLFLLMAILFLLVVFVRELKRYFLRDKKIEELRETHLEGGLVDIDLDIATEKHRQDGIASVIKDLKKNPKN